MEELIFSVVDVETDKILFKKIADAFGGKLTDEQIGILYSLKLTFFKAGFELGSSTNKVLTDLKKIVD